MRFSNTYIELNKQLHSENNTYGTSGRKWAREVTNLTKQHNTQNVLDYGCGKSTLQKALTFDISQYDPAIEEFSAEPSPHDIVVCTDVLEHIEPDCIDAVLDHIQSLTKVVALLTVATRPAVKTLPDGRNAHLIVEPKTWWMPKIEQRFGSVRLIRDVPSREFTVVCQPAS